MSGNTRKELRHREAQRRQIVMAVAGFAVGAALWLVVGLVLQTL